MPLLRTSPKTLAQARHLDALASEMRDPLALERAYAGRDPRGLGRRSGSPRGGGRRSRVLVGLNDGTFSRSSEIYVRTGTGSTGKWVASGDRAIADIAAYVSGATGKAMVVTGAHTNELTDSDDLSGTAWTTLGSASVTTDQDTWADGSHSADELGLTAGAGDGIEQAITHSSLTDSTDYTFAVWLRVASGTETVDLEIDDKSGNNVVSTTKTVTTTWQRFDVTGNVGTNATPQDPKVRISNTDATARDVFVAYPNLTQGTYPVPTIRGATPATLAATSWTVSSWPSRLGVGKYQVGMVPLFSNAEKANTQCLLAIGAGIDDSLLLVTEGDNDTAFQLRDGGVTAIGASNKQYNALSRVDLTFDAAADELTFSGLTVGDGTNSGAWEWPTTGTLSLGHDGSGGRPFNGLITTIEKA